MAELSAFQIDDGIMTEIERTIWTALKPKLCELAWRWYDANKDVTIVRFLGFPIKYGSFGIASRTITALLGQHP